jgi:undecaprenyl diphosphate synthase
MRINLSGWSDQQLVLYLAPSHEGAIFQLAGGANVAGLFSWPRRGRNLDVPEADENSILQGKIPVHVAIIMDGNGRWARKRGLPRIAGHKAGADAIRDIVRFCGEAGIRFLTLYAFSTENWKRPHDEVEGLMNLLLEYLDKETPELHKNGVRIRFLGALAELRPSIRSAISVAEEHTSNNSGLQLNIAVNYGSRPEMVRAVRLIAEKYRSGELASLDSITEETISEHLYTAGMPDPDLLIRPGEELRLSNFLLWQSAYTEIWTTSILWPDFRRAQLIHAIADFQKRERRYGNVGSEAGEEKGD